MRSALVSIAAATVTCFALAACASNGVQSLPGSTSAAGASRAPLHLVVEGVRPDASCPKKDAACITIRSHSANRLSICISSGSCSGSLTQYSWTSTFTGFKGHPFNGFSGYFNPNPGNPTNDYILVEQRIRNSHGRYVWTQEITACPTSGSCVTGNIGIATENG